MCCISEEQEGNDSATGPSKREKSKGKLLCQIGLKLKDGKMCIDDNGRNESEDCGKDEEITLDMESESVDLSQSDQWVCDECCEVFEEKGSLEKHQKTHEKRANEGGSTLPSTVKNKDSNIHMVFVEIWFCPLCNENFTDLKKLNIHAKSAHVGHWWCHFCHDSFTSKGLLIDHVWRKHNGEETLDNMCSLLKTPSKAKRAKDVGETRIVEVEKWMCHLCSKSFKDKDQLVEHMYFVHEGKWLCHFCDKPFTDKENLIRHLKMHESPNKKPNIVVIKQPEKITGGQTPRKFVTTGKSTPQASANAIATKSVGNSIDEKETLEFACNACSRVFTYKKSFKKHMRTHTTNCEYCNQRVNTYLMDRHLMEVHPRKEYMCTSCNMNFVQKFIYSFHMQQFHDTTIQLTEADKKKDGKRNKKSPVKKTVRSPKKRTSEATSEVKEDRSVSPKKKPKKNAGVVVTVMTTQTPSGKTAVIATQSRKSEAAPPAPPPAPPPTAAAAAAAAAATTVTT